MRRSQSSSTFCPRNSRKIVTDRKRNDLKLVGLQAQGMLRRNDHFIKMVDAIDQCLAHITDTSGASRVDFISSLQCFRVADNVPELAFVIEVVEHVNAVDA